MAIRASLTNHHTDDSPCPPAHKHTTPGKPLHPDYPGRTYTQTICSCGQWQMKETSKGYVKESRRHLATHPVAEPSPSKGPKILRDLLRLAPH